MKKVLLILIITLSSISFVSADNLYKKYDVELVECQNYNTFMVSENGQYKRIKLIAFDGTNYNQTELEKYVCNLFISANKIQIEYDLELKDAYNRYPVWVYLDGKRLQDKLISEGYGEVNYITNEYHYLDGLCNEQKKAITKKLGIWKSVSEEKYCQNGIEIKNEEIKKEEEIKKDNKHDYTYIYYILILNILMVFIILILRRSYVKER